MIKNPLYTKCLNFDFKSLFEKKGYAYFTKGEYNLNIIGVRANNNNKVTNLYDDILVVIYNTPTKTQRVLYNITTEPGLYFMEHKLGNVKGTAILVPGQYRSTWKIDKHRGKYDALCQRKVVKVYRDNNMDDIYDLDPNKIDKGLFGINIHRSNQWYTRETIDQYSAGCQVFNSPTDFTAFMRLCYKQRDIFGNSFTYTLIDEKDLDNFKKD